MAVYFQEHLDDAPSLRDLQNEFPELEPKMIWSLIASLRKGAKTTRGLFSSGPDEPMVIACIPNGTLFPGYGIGTKAAVGNLYLGNLRLKNERSRALNELVMAEQMVKDYPTDPKAKMVARRAQNHLDDIDEQALRVAERDELDKALEALLEREAALNLEMALEREELSDK